MNAKDRAESYMSGTLGRSHQRLVEDLKQQENEASLKAYKGRSSYNNPLYTTASSEIGNIPRGYKLELVPPIARKAGSFSDEFSGGMYKFSGLNTTVEKSWFKK